MPSGRPARLKIAYFAWVRERIGRSHEEIDLPAGVETIADLIQWLTTRGPEYAAALARPEIIRAAIDHRHVKANASLAQAREVALFPPVTGG